MKSKNEVVKHVWKLLDHVKATVSSNLVVSVSRGDLKVDRKDLESLVKLVNMSVEQAANAAAKDFEKQVTPFLVEDPETKTSAKKK